MKYDSGDSPHVRDTGFHHAVQIHEGQRINQNVPDDAEPKHLLWGLVLLKNYAVESVSEVIYGVRRKTFRRWSRLFIKQMASMSLVSQTKGIQYTLKNFTNNQLPPIVD